MIEIDSASILKKEPLKIRFTGDLFGSIGLRSKVAIGEFVVSDRGIALEIKEEVKGRALVSDNLHWFRFKAKDLGSWADKVSLSEEIISRIALKNPDMVCNGWPDVLLEDRKRTDFKRARRPLVRFLEEGSESLGILWETYPSLRRLGVFIGRDSRGLGGHVRFYDFDEFKVL